MAIKQDTPLPTEPIAVLPEESGEILYTRAMLEFLETSGLLEGRFELINGRIISKMGQYSPHNITVVACLIYLSGLFPKNTVRSQSTLEVGESDREGNRPEPDVFVLREPVYTGVPSGDNVLLVVEVSNTTQRKDFDEKPPLYARAGVAEYWIVDLPNRTLTVFREPDAVNGTWGSQNTLAETQRIAPESAADATIRIAELLPPTEKE